jgi:hypothetical protein
MLGEIALNEFMGPLAVPIEPEAEVEDEDEDEDEDATEG